MAPAASDARGGQQPASWLQPRLPRPGRGTPQPTESCCQRVPGCGPAAAGRRLVRVPPPVELLSRGGIEQEEALYEGVQPRGGAPGGRAGRAPAGRRAGGYPHPPHVRAVVRVGRPRRGRGAAVPQERERGVVGAGHGVLRGAEAPHLPGALRGQRTLRGGQGRRGPDGGQSPGLLHHPDPAGPPPPAARKPRRPAGLCPAAGVLQRGLPVPSRRKRRPELAGAEVWRHRRPEEQAAAGRRHRAVPAEDQGEVMRMTSKKG
mmetsp:Transcript_22111/g.43014  ORF Transcript_22111/g.43014 Transcript_22111/m.43014 type:complete len:261 (-) Transcript_22111:378-1160(-)